MKRRTYAEDKLQAAAAKYIRTVAPQCVVAAVPNGGLRTKSEAAKLKWMGVLAGFPDMLVVTPRSIIFFEFKSEKGRVTPEQESVHEHLRSLGYVVSVSRSLDDVRNTLRACGVVTREAAQ